MYILFVWKDWVLRMNNEGSLKRLNIKLRNKSNNVQATGGSMLPISKVQSLLLHNDEAHPTKGFESLPCQLVYQYLEPIWQIDWQCVQSSNEGYERRVGHHLRDKQIQHHLKLKIEVQKRSCGIDTREVELYVLTLEMLIRKKNGIYYSKLPWGKGEKDCSIWCKGGIATKKEVDYRGINKYPRLIESLKEHFELERLSAWAPLHDLRPGPLCTSTQ